MAVKRFRELVLPWSSQPDVVPEIDWSNPITYKLVGLVWTGPQFSVELVGRAQWPNESFTAKTPTAIGVATEVTSASGGIYSVRQSLETAANSAANWRVTAPPVTIAWLGSLVSELSTKALFGVVGSNGTEGVSLTSAYGTNSRIAQVGTGPGTRVLVDGTSTPTVPGDTTWYPGVGLRAATFDASAGRIYDGGLLRASGAGSSANIFYDASFGRVQLLSNPDSVNMAGLSYWGGIWERALSEDEIKSLSDSPWQLFKPKTIIVPEYLDGYGIPTLSAAEVAAFTTTTARPRVTLTF